jgi:hypothetical protein
LSTHEPIADSGRVRVCDDCADDLFAQCSLCGEQRCPECLHTGSGEGGQGVAACGGAACGAFACARCLAVRLGRGGCGAWRRCAVRGSRECARLLCGDAACARECVACTACGTAACMDCLRRHPGCLLVYNGVDANGEASASLCVDCWCGPRPERR